MNKMKIIREAADKFLLFVLAMQQYQNRWKNKCVLTMILCDDEITTDDLIQTFSDVGLVQVF